MALLLSNLGTSLMGAASAAGTYTTNTIAPAAYKLVSEHVIPAASSTVNAARNIDATQVGPTVLKAGVETGKWVQANPGSTALAAGNVLTFAFPGLVVAPVLGALGFGGAGVAGASAAAAYQATAGPIAAKGLFATLTSAGAGGYGVAVVHGATRVGVAVVGAMGAVLAGVVGKGGGGVL